MIGIIGNVTLKKVSAGSVGYDLPSATYEVIQPGETKVLDLGFKLDMMRLFDHHVQITSKSGLASQGLIVTNSPGIIDRDYQGNIKVILTNLSKDTKFIITPGQAIAQLTIVPDLSIDFVQQDTFMLETTRGIKGLGEMTDEFLRTRKD